MPINAIVVKPTVPTIMSIPERSEGASHPFSSRFANGSVINVRPTTRSGPCYACPAIPVATRESGGCVSAMAVATVPVSIAVKINKIIGGVNCTAKILVYVEVTTIWRLVTVSASSMAS